MITIVIHLLICISLVLHPGLKLEYFHQHDWEEEWIENAESLVCDKYVTCYEGKEGPTISAVLDTPNDDDDFATFSNISVTNCIGSQTSELEEYLQKPVENVKEPLKWWVSNCHIYLNFYRMALDYLSIPSKQFIILIFVYITDC